MARYIIALPTLVLSLLLAGCGGGGGGSGGGTTPLTTSSAYLIGGSITGLPAGASVTLLDTGASPLTVTANGAFQFAAQVATGTNYAVSVGIQPTGAVCAVTDGMGIISGQSVTDIAVTCSIPYSIGGTIQGLASGQSVTLVDNSVDPLPVNSNVTSFVFPTQLAAGQPYTVAVQTQPLGQTCKVTNGAGLASSSSSTAVTVKCTAPPSEYAYVANKGAGTISAYRVGAPGSAAPGSAAPGALTQMGTSPFSAPYSFPTALAVDPTQSMLYVAYDSPSNALSAFPISATAGSLGNPVSTTTTLDNPYAVAVSPQGDVYVANSGAAPSPSTVSAFTFTPSSGSFSSVSGSPFAAGVNPESVAVNPAGTFAFVANFGSDTISVYAITSTGALTPVGTPVPTGVNPFGMMINTEGTFLYVANYGSSSVSAYSISSKGVLAPLAGSPFPAGTHPFSVAINPAGTSVYIANDGAPGSISAYSINPASGVLTSIAPPVPTGNNPNSITIDPSGMFAYVANHGDNTVTPYSIAPSGALSQLSNPVPTGFEPDAVTIAQP